MASEAPSPLATNAALAQVLRDDFLAFTCYMFGELTGGTFDPAPHVAEIASALEDVTHQRNHRLLLSHPPRHGKSTLASMYWVAWMLGRNPDLKFAIASYGADLSQQASRECRRIISHPAFQALFPNVRIAGDASAVEMWQIEGRRGAFKCVSVGGSFTGFGCNVLILDDPLKGFVEAKSETVRDTTWAWFVSDAMSRLEPWGDFEPAVVALHTRFHADDPIGRLLQAMDSGDELVDQYVRIVRPAIDAQGAPLWRSLDKYLRVQANTDPYVWAAMWQCDPMQAGGQFFAPEMFPIETTAPRFTRLVRHWDLAISKRKSGDFTTSALVGVDDEGVFWILQVTKDKLSFPEVKARIVQMAERDGPAVVISLPDDILGTSLYAELQPALIGRPFYPFREKYAGNKEARAALWQSKGYSGKLRLLRGIWNGEFLKEALAFPHGKHDDQVDAVSGAVHQAARFAGGVEREEALPPNQSWAYMMRLKQTAADDRTDREDALGEAA